MKTEMMNVDLDQIEVSTTNKMFRDDADFTAAALQDLVESILKVGVLSPILLRPGKKKKYELVCGERRYRACMICCDFGDRKLIPANVRDLTDDQALEAQVIENLQRENINPMREAVAFEWMTKTKKLSAAAIADRIGKSADYVQERIKLTSLTKDAQELVRTGAIPLKAGLKIARLPEHLQSKALDYSTDTVEGAEGKKVVFSGLERLQEFLDDEVFLNLAYADFDTADPNLVPSAGSCLACPLRTKNSGTLFDDVAKNDSCLSRGCFRAKQLAQYKKVEGQVKTMYEGAEILLMSRTDQWNLDDHLKKKLSPIIYSKPGNTTEINHAQAVKLIEQKKKIKIAILIGTDRNGKDSQKKFLILKTESVKPATITNSTSGRSPVTKPKSPALIQKEKDQKTIQRKQNEIETNITAQVLVKNGRVRILPDLIIREAILELFQNGDTDDSIHALSLLKCDFEVSGERDGKNTKIKIKGGDLTPAQDLQYLSLEDFNEVLEKVKGENLNALLLTAVYSAVWNKKEIQKLLKIDSKSIAQKAKTETATWWKKELDKRKDFEKFKKQAFPKSGELSKKKK